MAGIVCAKCGCETLYEGERPLFCSKCGSPLDAKSLLEEEIRRALMTADYAEKRQRLLALREKYGEDYRIEFEILSIGRLYERGGRPDFYRIPFWPLAALENPKQFSKKEREKMLVSFFENPEVERVKKLAADEKAFMKAYYERMARGYVDLFLKGSTANSTFLGFKRRKSELLRRCALGLRKMLDNLKDGSYPLEEKRALLSEALKRAFAEEFAGEGAEEALKDIGIII